MTACVKNHSRRVALAVSASLVGALSLGAATVPAVYAEGISTLATDQEAWQNSDVTYNVEPDAKGNYTVAQGDTFSVSSVKSVSGEDLTPSDYTVVYFSTQFGVSGYVPTNPNTNVKTLDGRNGGMPAVPGTYCVAIIEGDWEIPAAAANWDIDSLLAGESYIKQEFTVTATGSKTLNGAFAYEVGTTADVSDTSFQYNGGAITVGFAKGTKALTGSDIASIDWTTLPTGVERPTLASGQITVTDAGTYSGTITGANDYAGSTVEFSFTVSPIDLANDTITIAPSDNDFSGVISGLSFNVDQVYVNGVQLDRAAAVDVELVEVNDGNDSVTGGLVKGKYTFLITPKTGAGSNVVGTSAKVSTYNADGLVTFEYNGDPISDGSNFGTFDPTMNNAFDPGKLSASGWGKDVGFSYKVLNSDGDEVADYSQPGEYTLVLEAPYTRTSSGTYYGSAQAKFTVLGHTQDYGKVLYFVSVDGKNVAEGGHVAYTGEAFSPVYTLKSGHDTLVEGEDYTVAVSQNDEPVDEIKDPGTYTVTFKFAGTSDDGEEKEYTIVVDKATILSAQPTADFFATDGEAAAAPTFTGSTNATFSKGQQFDMPADEVSVRYYELNWTDGNDNGKPDAGEYSTVTYKGAKVDADELTEDGWYVAEINVLTTSETLSGSGIDAIFQVSTSAGFTDVDANEWYAQDVYAAKEQGYMTGIAGTKLFMPEAEITRGEIAQVFFNMAGRPDFGYGSNGYVPTKFADVDAWAWYAEPIAWASNSGVVTGYLGTGNFGPNDQASREQVAAMIYRYAGAQGKDTTVEDADAALAAYTDGGQVSDWAKTAMAWCVENGIFGVNTTELNPQANIQRAQVASIAVRVQPEALK